MQMNPQNRKNDLQYSQRADLLRLLIERLEHIQADSIWAHRASGLRRSLLRNAELLESGTPVDETWLEDLLALGFKILGEAAAEKA